MADQQLWVAVGLKATAFQKALSGMEKDLNRMAKQFTNAGRAMTTAFTVPIVAAFGAAGKEFTNLEATMAKMEGLVGLSSAEVANFEKQILALSPAVAKGPQELAEALYFITSAGIKSSDAMGVLEMAAKAGTAGLGETQVIADLLTSAINAYGIENLSAAKATDILVAAVREGKAEAPDFTAALGQVLPIASEMGVSFDQVAASVAAMTRTGTDAETGAMELKNILASLLKPSSQANKALADMGMSAAGLRQQIKEKGLLSALMTIREKTNQFGDDAMAKVFPNIRALIGVLDLMGANAEENEKIFAALTDTTGSLDKAFESAQDTAKFKMTSALMEVRTTLVDLGETVMADVVPAIEWLGEKVKALGDWWKGLDDDTKQFIVRAAMVLAAIGPVLLVVGGLTRGISGLIGFVRLLSGALLFPLSPFAGIKLAIVAVIAIGVLLYKNWETVAAVAKTVWNGITDTIKLAINGIIGLINGFIGLVNRIPGVEIPLIGKLKLSGEREAIESAQGRAAALGQDITNRGAGSLGGVGRARAIVGETALDSVSRGDITVNVTGNNIASDYDVNRVGSAMVRELRLAGYTP